MINIKEQLQVSLNEAKSSLWMIYSGDSGCTYLVSAPTLEAAKELVLPVEGIQENDDQSGIIGWLLDNMIKSAKATTRIIVDTDDMKSKGDKKY